MASNKRLFIAFCITTILIVTLVTSFGGNLFHSTTPSVALPTLTNPTEDSNQTATEHLLQAVAITPDTVQGLIASLQTQENYYRNLSFCLYWGDSQEESAQTMVEVWTDAHLTQVKKNLPSGTVRHDIIQGDVVYYWYDNNKAYLTQEITHYAQDMSQCIPSYQQVLDLETSWIQQADYRLREDIACIFVEAVIPPLNFVERYWIHAETGLLLAAETYDNQELIYSMEGFAPPEPYPDPRFTLPDGTEITS